MKDRERKESREGGREREKEGEGGGGEKAQKGEELQRREEAFEIEKRTKAGHLMHRKVRVLNEPVEQVTVSIGTREAAVL